MALIGIIFYGALSRSHGGHAQVFGHAFTLSSYLLVGVAVAVMAGIQLLPRRQTAP